MRRDTLAGNRMTSWQECDILDVHRVTEGGELVDGAAFNDIGVPADEGPYDFFVSYAPVDKAWAFWIAWQLGDRLRLESSRPPNVFVRDWNIVPGMHETSTTHRALGVSARVVLVLTEEYLANDRYGIAEWEPFRSADPGGFQRRVVPVQVKACRPDGFLQSIHLIDLVDQSVTSATDRLLAGITASVEGRAKPVTGPAFPGLGRTPEGRVAGPPFPGPPVLVGEPPTVPPEWFQDRTIEVEDIERHLGDARTGLVIVVGEEGHGKTAVIHRLWERICVGSSPLRVHGLVYLSTRGFWPVTAGRVIHSLTELFPRHEAEQLTATVQQPLPWVEKLDVLLDALAGRQVIVAIDAIEDVLDDDNDIADPALRELIDHLVPQAERGVRLLLAGRREVVRRFPDATHRRDLDRGLPERDAFALFQAMDAGRTLNLDVSAHDISRLHRLTDGSPRALELAYGVLASGDRSFTRLLEFMNGVDSKSMVVHLLARACERLSFRQRRALQALAVYGRPVPAAAVDHLVRATTPDLDSRAVLEQLRQLRLAQQDGERFSVPANQERDYLITLLRQEADAGSPAGETPESLLHRAADYFAGQRNHNPQWLADLRPHLVEIELRLRAGDYEKALDRMAAVDKKYLLGWGSSSALVPLLRTLLQGNDIPRKLEIDAESLLARALIQQEYHQDAVKHLERALGLASGAWRARRIALRQQLSAAYLHLGNLRQAAVHSRRACLAAIQRRRTRDAATALAGLAMCGAKEGKFLSALRLFAVARWMLKRHGGTAHEARQLIILLDEAWIHGQLGDRDRARLLLREGGRHAEELDERRWQGRCLLGEAQLALDDGDLTGAVALAERASAIGVSNGDRGLCRVAMEILAMAQLARDDLAAAARAADIARRNRGSVIGFGLVGLAAYRSGESKAAKAAFHQGCREADNRYRASERDFQFLDEYGLVTCGLALLGEPSYLTTALDAYGAARKITVARGAVARTLMLLKQFEPCAAPEVLDRVRAAATGERSGRALQDPD